MRFFLVIGPQIKEYTCFPSYDTWQEEWKEVLTRLTHTTLWGLLVVFLSAMRERCTYVLRTLESECLLCGGDMVRAFGRVG